MRNQSTAGFVYLELGDEPAEVPSASGEACVFLDGGADPSACPEVWDYLDGAFEGAVQIGTVTEVRARVETWRFGGPAEGEGAYEDVCEIRHVEPGDDPQYGTHFGLRLPGEVMDRLCEAWLSLRRSNREALAAGKGAGDGQGH